MTTPAPFFPLRWESTGDRWWFASPVDLAAATGRYDLLRALLRDDPNLLIQLTSLRRLRRLETVWDDDPRFAAAPRRRASVARALLRDTGGGLLRDGYGGWLLYTAASAGDLAFVERLLQGNPAVVFGEGEFGVTDMLYAAARGRSSSVFWMVYETALRVGAEAEVDGVFAWEMRNRAVHAAARGGSWEVLAELLKGWEDVLVFRDVKGSTLLHAAAGKGQVEVVKGLIGSFGIIDSRDDHGNTSLHVAAFKGHLGVLETLIKAWPASIYLTNNAGDTFLHVAVTGFKAPGFQWLDRQMELMRHLISGCILNIDDIINLKNNDGRSVLHMAVADNAHPDLVSLLMSVSSIDLNARDGNDMTPLDLLRQHPQSTSSEILIKQLISAGATSNLKDYAARSIIASQIKLQSIWSSPGRSFGISDAEIFSYAATRSSEVLDCKDNGGPGSSMNFGQSLCQSEESDTNSNPEEKKKHVSTASRLKTLLNWSRREKVSDLHSEDSGSVHSSKFHSSVPLRQRFAKTTSLPSKKQTLSVRTNSMPSPGTRKRFSTRLTHGVIQAVPQMAQFLRSSLSSPSRMSMVPHSSTRQMEILCGAEKEEPSASSSVTDRESKSSQKSSSKKHKSINRYFCIGSHDLNGEVPSSHRQLKDYFRDPILSEA